MSRKQTTTYRDTYFAVVEDNPESPKVLAVFKNFKAGCTFLAAKFRERLKKDDASSRHMNPQRRIELEIAKDRAAKAQSNKYSFGNETYCVWDFEPPEKGVEAGLKEALHEIDRMAEQRREVHERMMPKYYNPDYAQLHYGAEMKAMDEMRRRIVVLLQVCEMDNA